ncbi:immunoglobulin-like domain-containing protein [Faecalimicrobium sp. JNUCC 81]
MNLFKRKGKFFSIMIIAAITLQSTPINALNADLSNTNELDKTSENVTNVDSKDNLDNTDSNQEGNQGGDVTGDNNNLNEDKEIIKDKTDYGENDKVTEEDIEQPKEEVNDSNETKDEIVDSKSESIKTNEIVTIPDANLEIELRKKLSIPDNKPIIKSDLLKITKLSLRSRRIKNISGLEYCTNLTYLDLGATNINENGSNQISDISPLAGLTNLTYLSLRGNYQVSDISALSGLTNLTYLSLEWNQISDISPLSRLTNLTSLVLYNNQISDISPLSGLTNLTDLALQNNQISDISPLSGLTYFNTLYLNENQISDISPLKGVGIKIFDARSQKIQSKAVESKNNVAEVENNIKNIDGSIINVINISNGGTYNLDTNLIKWDNITSDINETYDFRSGNVVKFSGKVTLPIKYTEYNEIPTISAIDKTIKVGDTFNPLTGVTATDTEDGNLTNKIKIIENTVDTSKVGKYKVVYEVADSKGATTTITITVTVRSNDKPIIDGVSDITIKFGEVDGFNLLDGVTVTDDYDTGLVPTTTGIVGKPSPGINETYNITYTVTDSDNNTTTVVRKITVTNQLPTISGLSNITINDGMTTDIQAGVSANDTEDGNITDRIVYPSTDLTKLSAGYNEIKYSVTDSDGNTVEAKRIVIVRPRPPAINSRPVINAYDKTLNVGDMFNPLEGVSAEDKEDGDITDKIKVIKNELQKMRSYIVADKEGVYKVVYEVENSRGAKTTKTISVTVKNKSVVPPTEPDKPVVPPTEPDKPVVPPTEPDKPVVPPTEPDKPVVPPTESDKPVVPPTEPDKPVVPPTKPSKEDKPFKITIDDITNENLNNETGLNPKTGDDSLLIYIGASSISLILFMIINRKKQIKDK